MNRIAIMTLIALLALPAAAQDRVGQKKATGPASIDFGDDSGEWANDGSCDDRRFFGAGMATTLDWVDMGRDASDCRKAFDAGTIRVWDFAESRAATQCSAIDFGNDGGDFPDDGECDDPRFEGIAVDGVLLADDASRDATDCRRACEFGLLGLREY